MKLLIKKKTTKWKSNNEFYVRKSQTKIKSQNSQVKLNDMPKNSTICNGQSSISFEKGYSYTYTAFLIYKIKNISLLQSGV